VVLEAHRTLKNNEETWDYSLTGVCRHEDINPNTNTVLSRDIADLAIHKRERGQVREGYRRGWFTRFFDVINPF
jgi:flagellar L-ring protein precursor FlgH